MSDSISTFIGEDISGGERVVIEHFEAYGEVGIRVGGLLVAIVDSSEFFDAFEAKS